MELEFDKEIDAILRKARGVGGVAAVLDAPHLDADAVAAFVDNALPGKVKLLYTEHLADCGRCRGLLSQLVLMNETAASTAAEAAEVVGAAPAAESWWSRLFRTPNLALAMGALVLTFSGLLGYIVLTNRSGESNVAMVKDKPATYSTPAEGAAANTAVNVAPNSVAHSAASNANASVTAAATPGISAVPGQPGADSNVSSRSMSDLPSSSVGGDALKLEAQKPIDSEDDVVPRAPEPKSVASAPPAPLSEDRDKAREQMTIDGVTADRKDDAQSTALAAKRKASDEYGGRARDSRDYPAAKSTAGPSRASGNVQQQVQNNVYVPATRSVAGKTFVYRNSAWYDSAYSGQGTREIKRGSEKYQKLDGGLRSIAEQFGGTVIIVWGGKGYKIY